MQLTRYATLEERVAYLEGRIGATLGLRPGAIEHEAGFTAKNAKVTKFRILT